MLSVARALEPITTKADIRRWLLGTFIGAVAFRVVLFFVNVVDVVYETGDSWEYLSLAESMLRYHVFGLDGDPRMNRTPGYPAFLAFIFATLGRSPGVVTGAQIAVDAATCAMVTHIAIRARVGRVGVLVAAIASATCLYTVALSYQVMTETLYTFALVASVWVLPNGAYTQLLAPRHRWRLAMSGAFVGAATLIRAGHLVALPAMLAVAFLLLTKVLRGKLFDRRALVAAVVFGASATAVVGPWMLRNRIVFRAEYEKPDHSHVTPLGFKTDVWQYKAWYTPRFEAWRFSQEEPFVMGRPYEPPTIARPVYPGEKEEVDSAFAELAPQVIARGDLRESTLDRFTAIKDKRYHAAPRLRLTAPLSRLAKLWVAPRASVVTADKHGGTMSLKATVGLTLYNCVYVFLGLAGLLRPFRSARPVWAGLATIVGAQTALYSFLFSPQSRYVVPLFPLLCVGMGVAVAGVLRRLELRASRRRQQKGAEQVLEG